MPAPKNSLKAALANGRMQRGVWLNLASPIATEIAAQAGFDWCLIDAEHGPNDGPLILSQLHAMSGAASTPVVRLPVADVRLVKQALDLGVQSLLIPMIETVDQAQNMVRATRYPPDGIRGVGASLARASGYGKVEDYVATANAEICLILQVESHAALQEAGAIAALDGVDAVFIGPADLAADMGHSGNSDAPDVQAAIDACIADIRETGTAVGILAFDPVAQSRYAEQGVTFIGVGSDVTTLATGLRAIAGGL